MEDLLKTNSLDIIMSFLLLNKLIKYFKKKKLKPKSKKMLHGQEL